MDVKHNKGVFHNLMYAILLTIAYLYNITVYICAYKAQ